MRENPMTDRYYALTVCLDKDIREDDATLLIDAIMMLRGVICVKPNISNPEMWAAELRASVELRQKIMDALYPKAGPR
jgi:hypothetical protein